MIFIYGIHTHTHTYMYIYIYIQCVPLATEPGISLLILTPMKILQRNLNRSAFVVWEMKRNVSVVCVCSRCNILISGKIIKEMPGSVASGILCVCVCVCVCVCCWWNRNTNNNTVCLLKRLKLIQIYVVINSLCTDMCSCLIQIGSLPCMGCVGWEMSITLKH